MGNIFVYQPITRAFHPANMTSPFKRLLTRLRGLLGLGVFGGISGAGIGAVAALGARLVGAISSPLVSEMVQWATGGLVAGAAGGVGFGVLLLALESRRTLHELPLWRMALLGIAAGITIPTAFLLLTSGTIHFTDAPMTVASILGGGAVLGGLFSSVFVGLAQRAGRQELPSTDGPAGIIESD